MNDALPYVCPATAENQYQQPAVAFYTSRIYQSVHIIPDFRNSDYLARFSLSLYSFVSFLFFLFFFNTRQHF